MIALKNTALKNAAVPARPESAKEQQPDKKVS